MRSLKLSLSIKSNEFSFSNSKSSIVDWSLVRGSSSISGSGNSSLSFGKSSGSSSDSS